MLYTIDDMCNRVLPLPNNLLYEASSYEALSYKTFLEKLILRDMASIVYTKLPYFFNNITSIEPHAFDGCTNLALTFLPDNIKTIKSYAFSKCHNISLAFFPRSLTTIESNAFASCYKLTSIHLPESLTVIETSAFYSCANLSSVTFEGTPTSISPNVFLNCRNLTTINVPWSEGEVANAPWGATNATINYGYKKIGVFYENGNLVYYKDGKLGYGAGLILYSGTTENGIIYDNDYIYVKSNGQLAIGSYWVTWNNGLLDSDMYTFDTEGKMIVEVESPETSSESKPLVIKDGIVEENGISYYYECGERAYLKGVVKLVNEMGGIFYICVDGSAKLKKGKCDISQYDTHNLLYPDIYDFGEDGKYYPVKHGLFKEGDKIYYYDNGILYSHLGMSDFIDENGETFYIYVGSNSELVTGDYNTDDNNGLLPNGTYNFGIDGKYYPPKEESNIKNGIYEEYGVLTYYVDNELAMDAGLIYCECPPKSGFIHIRSNGLLSIGDCAITKGNNYIPEGVYNFDDNGFMTTPLVKVTQKLTNVTSDFSYSFIKKSTMDEASSIEITLKPDLGYDSITVVVKMGGQIISKDIFNGCADGVIHEINDITDDVIIAATVS